MYDRIWDTLPKNCLFTSKVTCYTESEAPYYYFTKMDDVRNTDSVTVIDIGGGSTDFVYFSENKPISASSVHFGCDILWGNGHKDFDNVREVAGWITPVPGGVGKMTIAMLLANTLEAAERSIQHV